MFGLAKSIVGKLPTIRSRLSAAAFLLALAVAATVGTTVVDAVAPSPAEAAIPAPMDLFPRGMRDQNNLQYFCFRGPKLVTTNSGVVIAVASGKPDNCLDIDHTNLVIRRSTNNGQSWGPLRTLKSSTTADSDDYNAVPVVDRRTGRIILFGSHNEDDGTPTTVYVLASDDNGANFTQISTYDWDLKLGPSHGIQLERGAHAGRLVIPTWTPQHRARLVYSDDGGTTWTRGALSTGAGAGEPSAFERNDGAVYVMSRNEGHPADLGDTKTYALSTDGGATWAAPFQTVDNLVAPKVYGNLLRLRSTLDGDKYDRVLFSSPAEYHGDAGGPWWARYRMVIRSSYTEGRTWQGVTDADSQTIYPGPSSYSAMTLMADDRVGLAFEAGDVGQQAVHEIRWTTFSETDLGLPESDSGGVLTPDTSGRDNTSHIHGTNHNAPGRFDGGVQLDGSDDYVHVPFAESLAVDSGDFTVMAWIKYSATTGNHPIYWSGHVGDTYSQWWLRAEPGSNRIHGRIQSGDVGASVLSTRSYNDGQWHHIAFQRQGGTLRLYVDGAVVGTTTGAPTGTISPGRPFPVNVGRRVDGAQHFTGTLDEVRLYRRALTGTEIGRIHGTNAVDVTGAVLRLPFHPNFATTDDGSGNDNDGFVREAITAPGRFGDGLAFDGVDDRVHIPYSNATNLASSPFTITTWFKYRGGTTPQTLFWCYGVNVGSQLWVRADPVADKIVAWAETPDGSVSAQTPSAYADDSWHFLALRRTADQLILSVDGADVATVAAPTGSLTAGHADHIEGIHLGEKLNSTHHLAGSLDEFRVHLRALSAAELNALRTTNTAPATGLALYLPLDVISPASG